MVEENSIPLQPNLEERRRILALVMEAGKTLLENGAEVFRTEQTMTHMAKGFHLREFHVYVIANGIFASAGASEFSEIRNVAKRTVHLGRVAEVNEVSRKITAGALTVSQAEIALVAAKNLPDISVKTRVVASAFGAFSFCFLFGGGFVDAIVSLFAGAALGGYLCWCECRKIENLFQRLTGAMLASFVCMAVAVCCTGLGVNTSAAIIGAFMILTPGVAFTMAIRDFVRSDYLSGTIRLIDALLVAASLAIGAGLALWLQSLLLGGVF